MCEITHLHVQYYWFICVTWLIHVCDVAHPYVRHDTFTRITRHTWVYDSFITPMCSCSRAHAWWALTWEPWLVHMCTIKRLVVFIYVWHDSWIVRFGSERDKWCCIHLRKKYWFRCVTWLIHTCNMTHSYVCNNSFILSDMTHSYV